MIDDDIRESDAARKWALAMCGALLLFAIVGCSSESTGQTSAGETGEMATTAAPSSAAEAPTGAFMLDLRTGTTTPLPSTSTHGQAFDDGYYYVPSPDGSRIYWESPETTASLVANGDGSQGLRLDPAGKIDYFAGGWSPDGAKIVYQRRDSSGDDFGNLVVEDVKTGRKTLITDLEQSSVDVDGWWYLSPTFTPDGQNVVFQWPEASSPGIKWDLWSVPVTGGEAELLVKNAAQATTSGSPTYAFVRPMSNFFAGSSLVITGQDGLRTLAKSKSGIFEPKLSPGGGKVAYQDNGSIYVVDVATGKRSKVAMGRMAAWVDDETLIVAPNS